MHVHRLRLLAAVSVVATSALLTGQMSGSYTVDPVGSGPRNFKDIQAAASALVSQGVSGPVDLAVAPGNYPPWKMDAVPGTSSANVVTFRSATRLLARIDVSQDNVRIGRATDMAGWIAVDGFDFYRYPNRSSACLDLFGDDLEVRSCQMRDDGWVHAAGARLHFHHNETFGTDGNFALTCNDADGVSIHHNEIVVSGNGAFDLRPPTGGAKVRARIYNNVIYGDFRGQGSRIAARVDVDADFVHNTVVLMGSAAGAVNETCVFIGGTSLVRNNILAHTNLGRVLNVGSGVRLDHNLYHAPNSATLINSHATLAAWQQASGQDAGSLQKDPLFVHASQPATNLRILPGSPAAGNDGARPSYITDDILGRPRPTPGSIGAYEGVPGTLFHKFGAGCAGTLNNVPRIGYSGDLRMGSTNFAVTLSNALGGTGVRAFFTGGATTVTIPFGGGCDLLVSPDIVFSVSMGGSTGPANGTAAVKLPLPNDPKLKGVKAHFQWGVVDPAAKGIGVAFSDAATLTL